MRFVDLAPVQRADLVVAAIAAGLGLRTSGGPLIADVKAYLRARRLVLLLDNFEQVTAAAPLVELSIHLVAKVSLNRISAGSGLLDVERGDSPVMRQTRHQGRFHQVSSLSGHLDGLP